MSDLQVVSFADRPELDELSGPLGAAVWPEYNRHGDVLNPFWGRLGTERREFQFGLLDADDRLVAAGFTLPIAWDGTVEGLPAGIDGAIAGAFADDAPEPNTLCAMAAELDPGFRFGGLSGRILEEMRAVAARHGYAGLVAPLRPTWKERYPLTPIDEYAGWTRESDGAPFDPWIRLHVRLGAELLKAEPESLRITGTIAEWEDWLEMALPASGTYVFPHGLAPLEVDRDADVASYWEPNVWVRHPVEPH